MKLINNNCILNECRFCKSTNLIRIDSINYPKPVQFSSVFIELLLSSELYKCDECLSGFIQNSITQQDIEILYTESDSEKRWSTIEFKKNKPLNIINTLKKNLSSGKVLVDVGCNTGELLDYAKSFGCITLGIELSKSSRKIIESKGHLSYESLIELKDNSVDVITAFDLIEHLHDVNGFLKVCKSKLKDDGVLILLTGDINSISARLSRSRWWYSCYPEHISFVSKKYLSSIYGFILIESIHTYASIGYKRNIFKVLATVVIKGLLKRYFGLPSIGPDHYLYVLKRSNG